jgi:hypothetical protein
MAVRNPRNRILIFRLTKDEYETLQMASTGARSLSEYARAKLLGPPKEPAIDEQLSDLRVTVARIAEMLERT